MSELGDLRERITDELGDRWSVYPVMPDAIPGPCFAVVLAEPALDPNTPCNFTARFDVLCIGGRVAVEHAQRTLDEMYEYAIPRFVRNGVTVERAGADQLFSWGGVDYLSRRITVWGMVNLSGYVVPSPIPEPIGG